MLNEAFIAKLKKTSIFVIIYTLIFTLFFSTLSYTLPFVLAFIVSIWTRPLNRLLKKKLKISNAISSLISTTFVFAVLLIIFSAILVKITNEIRLLLAIIPDVETMKEYALFYLRRINVYYAQIDPAIVEKLYQQLTSVLSGTFNITISTLNAVISFIISLPIALMIGFVTFLVTYFLSKDMPDLEDKFYSIFSYKGKEKMREILRESNSMISGYFKAYLTVIFITFVETLIGFTILGIDYALILSILCAIMDILPILGIGSVYIPLIAINFYLGNTFSAIGLIILYVVVSVVRQIIEPKLVSTNLNVHPVMIIGAIFIGLKVNGFVGMIFLIGLIVLYKILSKVGIL